MSTATDLGLVADGATVLNDSNRMVVRLTPCDVVARVTPMTHFASAEREVEVVHRLSSTDHPVAPLDTRVPPRVFVRDGFRITLWSYFAPIRRALAAGEYAQALGRLHGGLRQVDLPTPHFMDRVAATRGAVASRADSPDLSDGDRTLLAAMLRDVGEAIVNRRAAEQLLHGEPHPWNVLTTKDGPLFVDFENTCRGPIEYDLGWVPEEVSECYLGVDQELVGECRGLVLAIIATHRWIRGDQHPSGRESGVAFLEALRAGPPWPASSSVRW